MVENEEKCLLVISCSQNYGWNYAKDVCICKNILHGYKMHVKYVYQLASNVINHQNVLKLTFSSSFLLYYDVSTF